MVGRESGTRRETDGVWWPCNRRGGLVVGALLVAAAVYARAATAVPAQADLFMQAIVTRDGALGWRQLCASAQAEMPLQTLVARTEELRALDASHRVTLSVDFVGARPANSGGEARVYVATARRPDAEPLQRTYTLTTQPGGCVEDVE
jgi:hypothetical protein